MVKGRGGRAGRCRHRLLPGAAQLPLTVTIEDVNAAPTAAADAARLDEDSTTELDVLANDSDPKNDTLFLRAVCRARPR